MVLHFINIITWLEQRQLPCLIKQVTGVNCPGCGLQRSCIALLKGDVVTCIKMYPAFLPMLLFFVYLMVHKRYQIAYSTKIIQTGIAAIFIIILASYIYKLTV